MKTNRTWYEQSFEDVFTATEKYDHFVITSHRFDSFIATKMKATNYAFYEPPREALYVNPTPWHEYRLDDQMLQFILHNHEYDLSARLINIASLRNIHRFTYGSM